MQIFWTIWAAQLISQIGSAIASFGLEVWIYQRTGSVTQFALIDLFNTLPFLLLTPVAGSLTDRYDRRSLMISADFCGIIRAAIFFLLLCRGHLEAWHIYLGCAVAAGFGCIGITALSASIAMLVPEQNLGRANGMMQFLWASSQIAGPPLAGILLKAFHLQGLMLVDLATFVVSLGAFLCVRVPNPPVSQQFKTAELSVLRDTRCAWNYIGKSSGLVHLLSFVAVTNFLVSIVMVVYRPMILKMGSPQILGNVVAAAATGMAIGSAVMAVWGGPQNLIKGIVYSTVLCGISLIAAGSRPSVPMVGAAAFVFCFFWPIQSSCFQSVLQKRVALDVQGRVFGVVMLVVACAVPLGQVLAGPLSDHVFEPFLSGRNPLAAIIRHWIGAGPGRGMGLLMITVGTLCAFGAVFTLLDAQISSLAKKPDASA